jgi:predicted amidohydrolase YtcJ
MSALLIRRAELDGRPADVRVRAGLVAEVGDLRPEDGEPVIDARGGALLPGLHDHHLHLLSLAAASASVRCGPPEVTDLDGLARVLRAAPGNGALGNGNPGTWVRGIGYHESVAGILDRHALDRLVASRPVRVQHRGGALWMLNTRALAELGLLAEHDDGRLWRNDALLRERLGEQRPPDLAGVGRRLASLGITGVTDATPELSDDAVRLLTGAALPQRLHLLGAQASAPLGPRVTTGPWKILPPDHEPPDFGALLAEVTRVHATGRPVAIHAVTRESAVLALVVLDQAGTLPGDRIEHAAVIGRDLLPMLARLAPVVVTQPGLAAERASQYRRDVPEADQPDLYRYASLLDAGIRVAPSSDAPFASEDPWRVIAAAATRVLAPAERITPRQALDGLLTPLDDPGGPPRRVTVGAPADLCLLHVPLAEALSSPDAAVVAATLCAGVVAATG